MEKYKYLEKIQIQLNTKNQSLEFIVEMLKWKEERRKRAMSSREKEGKGPQNSDFQVVGLDQFAVMISIYKENEKRWTRKHHLNIAA